MQAKHLSISGVVQGVGFRPFIYGLALRHKLTGWVCNTSAGVELIIEGQSNEIDAFLTAVTSELPPLAQIDRVDITDMQPEGAVAFEIRHSVQKQGAFQPISADVAICDDCLEELFDPDDRRYLYPFINCTNCGPRFTIIRDIPYDRPFTTMAEFPLCGECLREYENPLDRRFHAQPVACPACGPQVWIQISGRAEKESERLNAVLQARKMLRDGKIIVIRGLGGVHLACDAANDSAVNELRRRKGRSGKPLALMAADLETIEQLCKVEDTEREVLSGREKPIVLIDRLNTAPVSTLVAPGVDTLGVMLPYTPLHHLLINQTHPELVTEPVPPVLVMTSGNYSEEPIATTNEEALSRLASLADAFLLHNREIETRCDDSVIRIDELDSIKSEIKSRRTVLFLRRSRGYAPYPVHLPFDVPPILAVGGELKNTFCLTRERYAFLSQHIGDMENLEMYAAFERGVEHLGRLFRVEPQLVCYDLHPGYFSTKFAINILDHEHRVGVQHHHAHIAACMADNGLSGEHPVIGLSFDGTGYGTDGKVWGGEFLIANYDGFERAGHLEYLPLPGGDLAIHQPWRTAVGYTDALGLDISKLPVYRSLDERTVKLVHRQVERKLNTPLTSSLGRLFDAVAVLTGGPVEVSYEAQAAIELEALSKSSRTLKPYQYSLELIEGCWLVRLGELLGEVILDIQWGITVGDIGSRFHRTVAEMAVDVCTRIRERTGLEAVALSGGVWQNQVLLNLVRTGLKQRGFVVYFHRQVPTNDGGLALGQAIVGAQTYMNKMN